VQDRSISAAGHGAMKHYKVLLIGGLILIALLSLKAFKQFIYLSFTLLTLKAVWLVLILLFVLTWIKKQANVSRKVK
jgi:hypothetical protein